MREQIRFIDLFAGIGGFRMGLERVNEYGLEKASKEYKCVWSNEWDKYATQVYKKHWGECDTSDITTVNAGEIPKHDLICGGFPCQSFSVAGKRLGFEDTRGTLFYDIVRIAKHKRPRHLLLENVKGLLSHDEGKTFQTMLGVLSDIGYRTEWMVLNSKDFGIPQNRERVFIIGHLGKGCRGQVFPIGETNKETWNIPNAIAWSKSVGKDKGEERNEQRVKIGEFNTLSTGEGGSNFSSQNFVAEMKVANAVTPDAYLARGERKRVDGKAVLTSMHERRIRRLTPTECARLQGFPDDWCEGLSDTQQYKCYGNAVTTNVITEIGKALLLHS